MNIAFVCGSRATPLTRRPILWRALDGWHASIAGRAFILHGECRNGPDKWADTWATTEGVHPIRIPALWDFERGTGSVHAAGPKRNAAMRDVLMALRTGGARVTCLAMPYGKARGTRGMMNLLEAADFAVEVSNG